MVKNRTYSKLFVYGIFLDEVNREHYGMKRPQYATVPDFITVGGTIVKAVKLEGNTGVALTGLLVDAPNDNWKSLDSLEGAYERVTITTTSGTQAFMYAERGTAEALGCENASTYDTK